MSTSPADTIAAPVAAEVRQERRTRIPWTKIVLEAFFVMLGVLLALIADEWRQNHDDKKRAERALISIVDELNLNRDAVAQSLDYHVKLTQQLRQFESEPGHEQALADPRLFNKGFVHPAALIYTAWDSAQATDAVSHMPYERVLTLSGIYEQQHGYEAQSREVEQLIFGKLLNDGYESMLRNHANLLTVISTFWFRECQLLRTYDTVFERLGSAPNHPDGIPDMCQYVPKS